jgi:hypothetical protein
VKGIPTAGTPVLDGPIAARVWYDFWFDIGAFAQSLFDGTAGLRSYTVATLPDPSKDGLMAFCTDEAGGAVPVFSLAGQWRRVTDRAVVS